MNFFLDSTIFNDGKDVYLKNKLSNEFLRICKQNNFSIFISPVVIAEIRRQYAEFMQNHINNIHKGIGAIKTIPGHLVTIGSDVNIPNMDTIMKSFDSHFKDLDENHIIKIVPYSNDFLPELIHRSIHRIKPFTEAKEEFRDAVIWFSYAAFAEENQLENCYLISANTTDYLNKAGNIHEELVEKSNRFTLLRDMFAVLNAPFMVPFKEANETLEAYKKDGLDKEILENFLVTETRNIEDYLTDDSNTLAEAVFWSINLSDREIIHIDVSVPSNTSIRGIDIINHEYVVSGSFSVDIKVFSQPVSPSAGYYGSGEANLSVYFNAVYDPQSNSYKNLEISSYEDEASNEYWEGVHRVGQDKY
ncbi:PIN domain-containing protein [Streptomyces sp. NPDC057131]|uniref:PIN domain-containing protein n=1 Tax=Streptomyces sp. NPDC057131 TaxID=3346027 RepID=UPI0036D35417